MISDLEFKLELIKIKREFSLTIFPLGKLLFEEANLPPPCYVIKNSKGFVKPFNVRQQEPDFLLPNTTKHAWAAPLAKDIQVSKFHGHCTVSTYIHKWIINGRSIPYQRYCYQTLDSRVYGKDWVILTPPDPNFYDQQASKLSILC